jgi:hypothetical protein
MPATPATLALVGLGLVGLWALTRPPGAPVVDRLPAVALGALVVLALARFAPAAGALVVVALVLYLLLQYEEVAT